MSENTQKINNQQPIIQTITSKDELLNAFKTDFATSATSVYINSLNRDICFREITVKEQKTLTRIMASNENRKDIIFDAQCALIQQLCLDSTFDVYSISEFDRLKLLIAIYQTNMFTNDIKFTCSECGTENTYKLDFEETISKLNNFDLNKKLFLYENKKFKYTADVEYPYVKTVSEFHKSYINQNRPKSRRDVKTNDTMENIEYLNLFISKLDILDKNTNKLMKIDFKQFKINQLDEIISAFPQDVLYSDNGLIKFIIDNFIKIFNDTFDKHPCYNCGTIHEKGDENNIQSFF